MRCFLWELLNWLCSSRYLSFNLDCEVGVIKELWEDTASGPCVVRAPPPATRQWLRARPAARARGAAERTHALCTASSAPGPRSAAPSRRRPWLWWISRQLHTSALCGRNTGRPVPGLATKCPESRGAGGKPMWSGRRTANITTGPFSCW